MKKMIGLSLILVGLVLGVHADRRGQLMKQQTVGLYALIHSAFAYYKMDSSLGYDETGHLNLTTNGSVILGPTGKINGCAVETNANNCDDFVGITSLWNATNAFTFRVWLSVTNIPAGTGRVILFFRVGNNGSAEFALRVTTNASSYQFTTTFVGGSTLTSSVTTSFNSWTHVVTVWRPDAGISDLYVNGTLTATGAEVWSTTANSFELDLGNVNCAWGGAIDECGLWTIPWTAQNVLDDYNSGVGFTW